MEEKKGFFKRLAEGLTKTRDNIVAGIDNIFSGFSSIDDDFYEVSRNRWTWARQLMNLKTGSLLCW